MKKQWALVGVLAGFVISGCSTNRLGDPDKARQIKDLSRQGEEIMQEIDLAKSEKERALQEMKRQLMELQNKLDKQFGNNNFTFTREKNGIQVTILDSILFRSGSDEISEKGQKVLADLAEVLKSANKDVQITGHTDNAPISASKEKFKSNWDLSMQRALSVLHQFEASGVPSSKMFVVGYGEYKPIASNVTSDGRAHNRRVEVLILDELQRQRTELKSKVKKLAATKSKKRVSRLK